MSGFDVVQGKCFLYVLVFTIYQLFELCDARCIFHSITVVWDLVSPFFIQMLQNLFLTHNFLLGLRLIVSLNLTFLPQFLTLVFFSCLESTHDFLNFLFLLIILVNLLIELLIGRKPIALDPMLFAIESDVQICKLHDFFGVI